MPVIKRKKKSKKSHQIQCDVCLVDYEISTHEPYILTCGHNICQYTLVKYKLYNSHQHF